jgi:hypothetical protein
VVRTRIEFMVGALAAIALMIAVLKNGKRGSAACRQRSPHGRR